MCGLVLLLVVSSAPTGEALLEALHSPDAAVRRSAQTGLLAHCVERGASGLHWLRSIRTSDPDAARRLRIVARKAEARIRLVAVLEPFRKAGIGAGTFVRYETQRAAADSTGRIWSFGWSAGPGRVVDCTIAEVPARRQERYPFGGFCHRWMDGHVRLLRDVDRAFFSTLLAHWSHVLGNTDLAQRLVDYARRGRDELTYRKHLRKELAAHLGDLAAKAAYRGRERHVVLALWRRAARLDKRFEPFATGVRHQIEAARASGAWPLPRRGAPPAECIPYYIDKLKSSRTSRSRSGAVRHRGTDRALVEVGWPAIGALIPLLEDTRPTRGLRHRGRHVVSMTQGELCRAMVEKITGRSFETVRDAMAWWRTARRRGPVAYYGALLERGEWPGAAGLMKVDPRGQRDRVLAAARKYPGVLSELVGHLDPSYAPRVRPFLRHGDAHVVLRAAILLWNDCRDDSGMRKVAAMLTRRDVECWFAGAAARPLAGVDRPFAGAALAKAIRLGRRDIRDVVLADAGASGDRRVRDALVEVLDDRRWTAYGRTTTGRLRACDIAAKSLARMTGYIRFRYECELKKRDARIADLRAWLRWR